MDEADENTIRAALTDQLKRCEARAAKLAAELESVTAAMKQADAANVALAGKLETATAAERERCARIAEGEAQTSGGSDPADHIAEMIRSGT